MKEELIEQISELIHEEWMLWAKMLIESEPNLSKERVDRWQNECFCLYSELHEDMKNLDRMFATKFLQIINK